MLVPEICFSNVIRLVVSFSLPRPLEENSVNVAVALDVLRWRGG